jgi:UDP-glucose 4-epimerase
VSKWIVTGGAGYIGAHVVKHAMLSGRELLVIDDLSSGIASRLDSQVVLYKTSLQDSACVNEVFDRNNITGVLHLAAKKQVGESVKRPDYYWQENVVGLENLLSVMRNHGVDNFVFSSSAAVYGQPELSSGQLINERTKCEPINPYGATKLEGEIMSRALAESDGLKVAALRYFNVAGAGRPDLGDQYIFNLVPIVFDAIERGERPIIFGNDYSTPDGSCIRDYVHVQDLAEAHISAMDFVENSDPGFTAINIGTGSGASVFEVLSMIQEVTGISVNPTIGQRREGDPAALVADVSFAKEVLGWQSSRNLRDIVTSAWDAWKLGHK